MLRILKKKKKFNVRSQSLVLSEFLKALRWEPVLKSWPLFRSRDFEDHWYLCVCVSVSPSIVSDSLQPHGPHQAPLSMGFSRQECWSELPFPSPGLNPGLLHCRQILYHLSHKGCIWCLGNGAGLGLCLVLHVFLETLCRSRWPKLC